MIIKTTLRFDSKIKKLLDELQLLTNETTINATIVRVLNDYKQVLKENEELSSEITRYSLIIASKENLFSSLKECLSDILELPSKKKK